MKIKDLINILNDCPHDAWVTTSTSEDICIGYLKDKKTIFIDPADCCPTCMFYDGGYCHEQDTECYNVGGCDNWLEK